MRNAKRRIHEYTENPSIGMRKVENFLDSLHAIRFQTERYGIPRKSKKEIKNEEIERYNKYKKKGISLDHKNLNKRLLRKDRDLLSFLLEYSRGYKKWQLDLIEIVKDESHYFMPQIKTKILNEGWASFWHYKILHDLTLEDGMHVPFLKMHNAVVRPHIGGVNPYHVGFYIFQKLEREFGLEKCFEVREIHDDVSAIRLFLDESDFRELNMFSYEREKNGDVFISEVSDHDDWKVVRDEMIKNTGVNTIPHIFVDRIESGGTLVLKHEHDGRDLDLDYADSVVDHIRQIWKEGDVKLFTIIENDVWEI